MLCRENILTPDRVAAKGVAAGWGGNLMHAYYEDLCWFVRQRWTDNDANLGNDTPIAATSLPPPPLLEDLFSTCYQASKLREEERSVQVRLVLADPELFPAADVPPLGLHRQMFAQPRPCDEMEVRKLVHPTKACLVS
jgi:Probable sensor domain DACNV